MTVCVTDQIVNVSFFKPLQRREREKQKKQKKALEKELRKIREGRRLGKEGERRGEKGKRSTAFYMKEMYTRNIAQFFGEMALTSARE